MSPRGIFDINVGSLDIGIGTKPRKRKPIDKNTKDAVWIRYMGNKVEGKCYCCKTRTIHITDFQVGHNKAVAKGGKNHIDNLRPVCSPCNRGMGTMSIERYKKRFEKPKPKKKATSKKKTTKIKKSKRKKPPSVWDIGVSKYF